MFSFAFQIYKLFRYKICIFFLWDITYQQLYVGAEILKKERERERKRISII